jgi:hypothetical protein
MKLILCLICLFGATFSTGLAHSQTIEFYYSSNLNLKPGLGVVYEGECKPNPDIKEIYRVDSVTQQVLKTSFSIDGGALGEPSMLENCKVIDYKNWVCGGNSIEVGNGLTIWSKTTVANGKIYVIPTHRFKNQERTFIPKNSKTCYFEKSLFGYKKLPPFSPY